MVSTMSGPIPPHPYYDKGDSRSYVDLPMPRVRPEAEDIAKKGQGTMGMLLHIEGQRIPSGYRKTKSPSKDHVSENVRRMRRIQRETKRKESDCQQPVKALWKSSKYECVQSRVREQLEVEPPAPRPHSASYLRAHSRTGWRPMSARPASTEPPEDKLTVPRASTARDVKFIRNDLDFIKVNGRGCRQAPMRRSPSLSALEDLKSKQDEAQKSYRKGAVPNYLVNRKKEWEVEAEERRANEPDPEMPEGHRLMPQNERRDTLDKIKRSERELLNQLSSLPIRTDTMRIRKRKEEIELKLAEIEEAIRIFSRPKVFVKLDG